MEANLYIQSTAIFTPLHQKQRQFSERNTTQWPYLVAVERWLNKSAKFFVSSEPLLRAGLQ